MTKHKGVQPIPPLCEDKPWNVATLKALSAEDMRKYLRLYGANQINAALAKNKENR